MRRLTTKSTTSLANASIASVEGSWTGLADRASTRRWLRERPSRMAARRLAGPSNYATGKPLHPRQPHRTRPPQGKPRYRCFAAIPRVRPSPDPHRLVSSIRAGTPARRSAAPAPLTQALPTSAPAAATRGHAPDCGASPHSRVEGVGERPQTCTRRMLGVLRVGSGLVSSDGPLGPGTG
jgi:hypothetical protein